MGKERMKIFRVYVYLYLLVHSETASTMPPLKIDKSLLQELESFSEDEEFMSKCREFLPKQAAISQLSKDERIFPFIALIVAGIDKASAVAAKAAAAAAAKVAAAAAAAQAAAAAAKAAVAAAAAKAAAAAAAAVAAKVAAAAAAAKVAAVAAAVEAAVAAAATKAAAAVTAAKAAAAAAAAKVAVAVKAKIASLKIGKYLKHPHLLGGLAGIGVGFGVATEKKVERGAVKGREMHQDLKQRCLRIFNIVATINRMTIEVNAEFVKKYSPSECTRI